MKIKKKTKAAKPDQGTVPSEPEALTAELARERALQAAQYHDGLERERAQAEHGRDRKDLAAAIRLADLRRNEREADVEADVELARMYREYRAAGERTRVRSEMARSGEARALRLEQLRTRNLWYLVPLLIGFGAWSTTGVQQGTARLMGVTGGPVWWALWGLEALLIGVVCRTIVVRARLASSGGELDPAAERIAWGCLMVSIFLNLVAAVPSGDDGHVSGWAVPGAMLAHAIGPVGAAFVAHLIGVFDKSIAAADPWHEKRGTGEHAELVPVPRLAEMRLKLPESSAFESSAFESGAESASEDGAEAASESGAEAVPPTVWPVPREGRPALTIVARPLPESAPESGVKSGAESTGEAASPTASESGAESSERIGSDQAEERVSEAVAETPAEALSEAPAKPVQKRVPARRANGRANKGVRVPAAARKSSSTARRSDDELLEDMVAAIDAGRLSESASNRQVQTELGIGFERAKRIKELYGERLDEAAAELEAEMLGTETTQEFQTRPELAVVGGDRR